MKLQRLTSCCSTVYLYNYYRFSSVLQNKTSFRDFVNQELCRDISAIIYINSDSANYISLRRIGFKRKFFYNSASTEIGHRASIWILDLRKLRRIVEKEATKISIKKRFKNWVSTW